ncbi:MAG: type I restriction enzyme HsdR N-terminal domain-containing protein [Thermoplasmata archaeon]|nr:type I restriction enzyme HsdR N-terminal domain-containing protein [Thermoplasmata archaeon]MCI4355796.1 type I restriction enzyme HsdR N-terminal domain-containing protein [Thermoplasmata archaeon]
MEATDLTRRMNEFCQVASEVLRDVQDITDQQVKHWIVNPFLITLGWDPHDKKQVFLDFPVKADHGHADYALLDVSGRPRLILEVGSGDDLTSKAEEAGKKAKGVGAPLALLTNGRDFSLWYIGGDEPATPLFVLPLKELADNAEALLGLTVEYRLSDTGINQLRKSAIRLAVLQMLEENSEKTFDAMVNWVQSQVAPGALDETTEQAIRDATMIWLTEEHLTMPAFSGGVDARRPNELRPTTARDWDSFPKGPNGTFQYKYDATKTLDLRQPPKEVKAALRVQGLRTPTATSFGGFYYSLRQRAGLPTGSS